MLPNFVIIGAAKAGTTSLFHYVSSHPQAFMPPRKELSFFCEEFNWRRGIEWYERQFGGGGAAVALGEASPRYTVFPLYRGVPERMSHLIPEARLIYLVRHPIERMQSQYLDSVIHGQERRFVEEALSADPFYLTSSKYALQIEQYLPYFPRSRILVIRSDDMRRERVRTLSRVFAFLQIDPHWNAPVFDQEFLRMSERRAPRVIYRKLWYSSVTRKLGPLFPRSFKDGVRAATSSEVDIESASLSPAFRRHLEDQLRDDVRHLYDLIDDGFDGWGIA